MPRAAAGLRSATLCGQRNASRTLSAPTRAVVTHRRRAAVRPQASRRVSDQSDERRCLVSRLNSLLRHVETQDPQLAADLKREVEALSGRRAFGLNFERHLPETVELPRRPVRKGDKVRLLPKRGETPSQVDHRLWRVDRIRRTAAGRVADLVRQQAVEADHQTASRAVDDVVVVAEFRDPIYPG